MRDFYDDNIVETHPIFVSHSTALQFVIYYDDIEVANALGAKAGFHKLGKNNNLIVHDYTFPVYNIV